MPLNDFERIELRKLKATEPSNPDLFSPRIRFDFMDFEEAILQSENLAQLQLEMTSFVAPVVLVWEITGNCHLHCEYCLGSFPVSPKGELTSEQKRVLAQELIDAQVWAVNLSGGEPLLSPDLPMLVDLFAEHQIPVAIVTSGWHLNPELAKRLLEHEEWLAFVVSLDAPQVAVHDELRGRSGAFDESLRALQMLRAGGARKISLECVVTRKNFAYVEEMVEFCRSLQVSAIRFQPVVPVGRGLRRNDLALTESQLWELATQVQSIRCRLVDEMTSCPDKPRVQVYLVDQTTHIRLGARTGRNLGGFIGPDGTVRLSAYLPYTFGNVLSAGGFMPLWRQGFKVAWKHPEVQKQIAGIETIMDISRLSRDADGITVALTAMDCVRQ